VGALLAARLSDTIKQSGSDSPHSTATLDRTALWRALTPQMFRYAPLCAALRASLMSGRAPTDEAQAFEWQGEQPLLVQAGYDNVKITTAEDLIIAEALLAARQTGVRQTT
jgi:2-C-methyl-D-erythritol 4-phosphate cytidylyltransferase